jgi:two-component system cell cycle response regulator
VRSSLTRQLDGLGHQSREAASGDEGLAGCAAYPPDAILLALDLPDLAGEAVVTTLAGRPMTAHVPVIVLATGQPNHDIARVLELGALDFVREPIDPLDLAARLGAALQLKAARDELRSRTHELDLAGRLDPLTGLINRREMERELARACDTARRHHRPLGVLIVDIDHFKRVNVLAGRPTGDGVLTQLGSALESVVRGGDTVGRWAGDQFLVLLPEADVDALFGVGERLRRALAEHRIVTGHRDELVVTVSIGGAEFGDSDDRAEHGHGDLGITVNDAAAALYLAKDAGGNSVFVSRRAGESRQVTPASATSLG